ncbi:MAG: hypothetical protein ABH885_05520 [Candidatus Omnitrophota bacterium]
MTVIHIQDAHANYNCQHAVADLINYISGKYGIETVNLEGGSGDYDLSPFTWIEERDLREKVLDYFVREGIINGGEYTGCLDPDVIYLWGVEDTGLYIKNLKVFREFLPFREKANACIDALDHTLNNLKRRIYSGELFDLDENYRAYKSGGITFRAYVAFLTAFARSRDIDPAPYRDLCVLADCLGLEDNIDFDRADRERDALISGLENRLPRGDMEKLVQRTVDFRLEKVPQHEFYEYLFRTAGIMGLDTGAFSNLASYAAYTGMYDSVDAIEVMSELDALEKAVKEKLFRDGRERELDMLSRNLVIARNMLNFTLTRDDYAYYADNRDSFRIKRYLDFIIANALSRGAAAGIDSDVGAFDSYLDRVRNFYEYSLERDGKFIENLKFRDGKCVLVTGGFHSDNLLRLFRERGIAYVSIMPCFRNDDGYDCPYFRLLAGKEPGILEDVKPMLAAYSSIQLYTMLSRNPAAAEMWGQNSVDAAKAAALIVWYAEQGKQLVVTAGEGAEAKEYVFGEGNDTEEMTLAQFLDAARGRPGDTVYDPYIAGDYGGFPDDALAELHSAADHETAHGNIESELTRIGAAIEADAGAKGISLEGFTRGVWRWKSYDFREVAPRGGDLELEGGRKDTARIRGNRFGRRREDGR